MLKRAFSLTVLMLVTLMVPMLSAAAPTDPGGSTAGEIAQSGILPDTGLVSLDFQDADIRSVLKVLAFKSGVNIVAAPDVTGVVNIELKDVPWQKALDVILSTYGYGFDRKGNIITVMTIENLKKYREDTLSLQSQEPLVSKTFVLSFAKAEDAVKIIDKLITKRGFINFDERTNSIIVRDLESNLELISGVIKSLDAITPQVLIETKVIETDLTHDESMGIDWTVAGSITGGSRSTSFPFPQKAISQFMPSPSVTPTSTFTYGTISATGLKAALDILSTRTNTHTLSNPQVVALDNEKTTINVGIQYPLATYSFNSSTGQQQVTGYTFLPIGVNFEVTPHVNNPGLITLEVHPQISALLTATVQIDGNTFPELSNQETKTKVMVENGKTLVIAGLITDKKSDTVNKVPILGDLPFIGQAFRSKDYTRDRTELLIFITPHVITVGNESARASVQ